MESAADGRDQVAPSSVGGGPTPGADTRETAQVRARDAGRGMFPPSDWSLSRAGSWSGFSVCLAEEDGVAVVRASGELDLGTREHMRYALSLACASGTPVTVDLSELTFIDAGGLGILIEAHNHLVSIGRLGLLVRGTSAWVRRVFEITDLTLLLEGRPGRELELARRAAAMSVTELFLAYFALGGTADMAHIRAHLAGRDGVFDAREQDVVVHAVNERFVELANTDRLLADASG